MKAADRLSTQLSQLKVDYYSLGTGAAAGLKSNFPLPCWYNTHSLPGRQPQTWTQLAGMVITEPGPKSLAEFEFEPVYHVPLMTTFVISLLCEWSGLSVPAGTFRICEYAPVLGSPERTANCMPFLSGRSTHFRSAKDTMNGALPSCCDILS